MLINELQNLRTEAKKLRQDNAVKNNSWKKQKKKNDDLENELKNVKNELRDIKKENEKLKDEVAALLGHRDSILKIIFKPNVVKKIKEIIVGGRKRGGQLKHQGCGRKKPEQVDQEKEVYLSHCPNCQNELEQSSTVYERTIEDIPPLETVRIIVTRYSIQRQWCGHCQKEVRANPNNTLPNFRLGLNVIGLILFLKYNQRLPLQKISESLKHQYGLKLSVGSLQNILHQLKKHFKQEYEQIIAKVKIAKLKHADETGWRIAGRNGWCWLFKTPTDVCYVIEETRGKGIPKKVLGEKPQGVLVRDDYPAYKHLAMEQQSCWTHLLRNSHDATKKQDASQEMLDFHTELKSIFNKLNLIIDESFEVEKRQAYYVEYQKIINDIISRKYLSLDVKKIQTRITNQNINLITAIKHKGVPLTNNSAERQIRQVAVARKISGGSRSIEGARTQAVNMSIFQTLQLRSGNLIDNLKNILQLADSRFCLERTE